MLTAFYDLEHGPVSYDFITWLVRAMLERDRRGCKKLHVVIVPKEDGLGGFSRHWGPHDEPAARWRLWHIVIAACPLAKATVTIAASRDQAQRIKQAATVFWWPEGKAHLAAPIVAAARAGAPVPHLEATEAARRYVEHWLHGMDDGQECVTLTLRNQSNDPARNTSDAWFTLRDWLEGEGYGVIVLNDTQKELERCPTGPFPALDIDLRIALYEQASMNIVCNNGPAALLWHSEAPYLRMAAGIPSDWTSNLGLEQGEQVPWATPDQRLVYAPDTFEAMREAFEQWK